MCKIGRAILLILIVTSVAFAVSGCDPYSWRHPDDDPNVIWVSKDPSMSFAWDDETGGHHGQLMMDGNTFLIGIGFRSDTMGVICEGPEDSNLIGKELFDSNCDFGTSKITVVITRDNTGIFGGDLPTIVFEKQDRELEEKRAVDVQKESQGGGFLPKE